MEEDFQLQSQAAASYPSHARVGSARRFLLTGLAAFLIGAGAVGWLAWRGDLSPFIHQTTDTATPRRATTSGVEEQAASLESRMAMLEDRFARLDSQASAASGNAARAEGLLVAFATRRAIERGQPLGYLADQLRLRFGNAQPRAVETLLAFAQKPVRLDQLDSTLDVIAPKMAEMPDRTASWDRVKRELENLFTVRRDDSPAIMPEARVQRAKLMLRVGRIDDAIEQISRFPGAEAAAGWNADARRYAAAQAALETIESSAMLEPHRLQDAQGRSVDQPSPLVHPAAPPSAAP